MNKTAQITAGAVAVIMLFAAMLFIFPAAAQARSVTAVEGAKFDTGSSLKDNLKIYVGKDAVIHLRSGKSFQGYIKAVGDHLIHVEKLAGGRDYYDALIRIEDITAIETKFREVK